MDHDLFKKFNVDDVTKRKIRPSMKPYVKEINDVSKYYDTPEHAKKIADAAG